MRRIAKDRERQWELWFCCKEELEHFFKTMVVPNSWVRCVFCNGRTRTDEEIKQVICGQCKSLRRIMRRIQKQNIKVARGLSIQRIA